MKKVVNVIGMPNLESYKRTVRNDNRADITITYDRDEKLRVSVGNQYHSESLNLDNIEQLNVFMSGIEFGKRMSWNAFEYVYDTEAWDKAYKKWVEVEMSKSNK